MTTNRVLRGAPVGFGLSAALALLAGCATGEVPEPPGDPALRVEWPAYGGDPGAQRYSPLEVISAANVDSLQPAWEWRTGESPVTNRSRGGRIDPFTFQATPIMLGDTLYLSTPFNRVVALDANSGRELWAFDPGAAKWGPIGGDYNGFVHRGVAVWSGVAERRVFMNSRWRLLALDAKSGRPIRSFGKDGEVDLTAGLRWPVERTDYGNTSPPVIWHNLVIVGNSVADWRSYDRDPPGDVQAFDVESGKPVWRFETVPRSGDPGSETWEDGANERVGHTNVWAPFTVDTARGLLYLPVSAPSNDWYGGRRKGDGLFAESIVCLDAATGKRVWHYQLVHHGLWDYDPPASPLLATIVVDGRSIDAVAMPGKTGFLYVFDRVTGRPVWPIEERPVPASDVPGERTAPTQPIPTRPGAFVRQGIGDSDLVDFTPELLAMARAAVRPYRMGPLFTPPSLQGTVLLPGWIGGAGWGGGAFDPASGLLYVKGSNKAILARIVPRGNADPALALDFRLDSTQSPEEPLRLSLPNNDGSGESETIPLVKPPYGTLTAFDLNRGSIRWQITLGDTPNVRFHPQLRSLNLPPLGVAGAPGPLVTKSGLVFLSGGGKVFYAIDGSTGEVKWSWPLEEAGYSNPMTYRTARGRQFIVLATGRGRDAVLRAFALPPGMK
ncbi:MAG: PQQ-binding-like beta-propeller repeat protein [Gemmatimonadales bacterium]|nr:PQQ-binding-like beta-propeller repeat protein [Gemmatimonadales bacterium]